MIADRWGVSDADARRAARTAPGRAVHHRRRPPRGRIISVGPGRQLTATIMGAYLSYLLLPEDQAATRLLLKVVARTPRWLAPALPAGDLVMARRQLLNFKRLAEQA